jgi:hypothetical protein
VTPGVFQPRIGYPDPSISNAFVTKLNSAGNGLIFSSYLGGPWCYGYRSSCFGVFGADEAIDAATSVAIDKAGFVYVGGYVTSGHFPVVDSFESVDPEFDDRHMPMIAKIAPAGDRLVFSAVLGSKVQDGTVSQVAPDGNGGVLAAGSLPYAYFPLTAGAVLGSGNSFLFKADATLFPTAVSSSVNPANLTQSIVLTASAQNPNPGGVVTFKDGANVLGTASVSNGTASLIVTLTPGVHRIFATNSADGRVSQPYFQLVGAR